MCRSAFGALNNIHKKQLQNKRNNATTAAITLLFITLTSRGFERGHVRGFLSEGGRREEEQGDDQQTAGPDAPRHVVAAAVARAGARAGVRAMRHPLLLQRPACNTQQHIVSDHLFHK